MIEIHYLGIILLGLLAAYLLLAAPQGSVRALIITLINVLLFSVVVYFVLRLFSVI